MKKNSVYPLYQILYQDMMELVRVLGSNPRAGSEFSLIVENIVNHNEIVSNSLCKQANILSGKALLHL